MCIWIRIFVLYPTSDDAIGGNMYSAAAAELTFNLPSAPLTNAGMRGHIFGNIGNLISMAGSTPGRADLQKLLTGVRASVGCGLVVPTGFGRLELNYVKPLANEDSDFLQNFQIGLGIQFL
jgi:outer membrane protein assembly factor BamA